MRDVVCAYGTKRAVDGVSLALLPGQTLGLVGESGSGKTTVLRLLLRLVAADGGSISLDGTDITRARDLRALRRQVQVVFQNPHAALDPRCTVATSVAEPLRIMRREAPRDLRDRVASLLEDVGLGADFLWRYPHELSGGQKQRVCIARALAPNPRALLLDEPTSALDVSVQAQIVELLARLRARHGLAYLFVSHNLAVVRLLCERVAVMRDGRIVEQGAAARRAIGAVARLHPGAARLGAAAPLHPGDPRMSRYRIGFDIGGTFTDFILLDAERSDIRLHKCLTTPADPSVGALEGLAQIVADAGIAFADLGEIVHGTTLVTNALIERRGASLGLITTEGFRDILEMGTEQRYDIYDLFLQYPEPLVPRRRRLEVPERMDRDGNVVVPLDLGAVAARARLLAADGVESIAVCFLHAYRNPAHERAAGEAIRAILPDIAVSLSSDVVSELWEYQRLTTTCANAFVQPLMDRYVRRLERELWQRGFRGALYLMHSAGGLVSPETARAFPIRLLESGPAGGGLATAFFGRMAGKPDVISFDMGGTTAKACLIEDGRAAVSARWRRRACIASRKGRACRSRRR